MIKVYTDGSCKSPGGVGGWAFIVLNGTDTILFEKAGFEEVTTSQAMEIRAISEAMEFLSEEYRKEKVITIHSDTRYGVKGCTTWMSKWKGNNWKNSRGETVAHIDLWQKIDKNIQSHSYYFKHVKAHNGHTHNEHVDVLAKDQWKKREN